MRRWLATATVLASLALLPGFERFLTTDDASGTEKTAATPAAGASSDAPKAPKSKKRRGIRGMRLLASFSPPSSVPYSATDYAARASRANSTGMTALASYASPASCPLKANLFSQDIEFTAPVTSLPGRAGLGLNVTLAYNSKVWIESGTTMFFDGDKGFPAPGWRLGFGRIDGQYSGPDGYNHYYFIDPSGNIHDLRYNSVDGLYESTDSTYLDFSSVQGLSRPPK
jgi:hypothetical protein